MRILIAEDNPLLGQNLKKSLEKYHYAVDLATNGEDVVALGLSIPYDLLILGMVQNHVTLLNSQAARAE
jgi:DNA-binding response OmpR family regulator